MNADGDIDTDNEADSEPEEASADSIYECGGYLSSSTGGQIHYVGPGLSYGNNENCAWTIQAPEENQQIQLDFSYFEV